jgi:hypothetical protein
VSSTTIKQPVELPCQNRQSIAIANYMTMVGSIWRIIA